MTKTGSKQAVTSRVAIGFFVGICIIAVVGCGTSLNSVPTPTPSGGGTGANAATLSSQLKGTWQDANGNILIIDAAGNVTQEKYSFVTLVPCDGAYHTGSRAGVQVKIAPYRITVDDAGSLTISSHSWEVKDSTGSLIYTSTGSGTLVSSREMDLTWIDTQGTTVNTYSPVFTKTGD